ncbi:MAG: hypothetical protein AMXMBFR82_05370 [Candidatus Hydrogenedentota bacterium]
MTQYRLSLDIGTNSIGWCALTLEKTNERLHPVGILDMGVRVFPDGRNPKDGSSNAVKRRLARSMRRNRDRYLERRTRLLETLVELGLMPTGENERRRLVTLDPYALRARGLNERLTLFELGRAIFHLNQRRGFKSNRKQDAKDKESGIIKTAIQGQRSKMDAACARTYGEYLFLRRGKGEDVRARLRTVRITEDNGREKNQEYYDIYPSRENIEEELNTLWQTQAVYYPEALTEDGRKEIRNIIIDQRDLKKPAVGKCTFERDEDRAPKASPLVQRCRIYQELNHLTIIDTRTLKGRALRIEERDKLAALLCQPRGSKKTKPEVSFEKMRGILGFESSVFSLESDNRTGLEGDATSAFLAHKDRLGRRWYELSDEDQEGVVSALLDMSDEEELIEFLMDRFSLDREHAENTSNTFLPDGYSRLGKSATHKILSQLVDEVIPYSEAVVRAGYSSHSLFSTGDARERLPYYGQVLERHVVPDPEKGGHPAVSNEKRYGKVTNPTVHIALNQLRKVVNEIIKLYGKPAEIHVEVLRDLKNSIKRKREIEAEQKANKDINAECARRLREEFNLVVNRENIQRLRLFSELDPTNRVCVYSGGSITARNLFTPEVEIDHILPFSRTLDDSMSNRILCLREANRGKSNASPFEAWGNSNDWGDILSRSALLAKNKRWRFAEDAMARYEKEGDFIARQLTDSQYIAKLARAYLAVLYPQDSSHKVVCIPGRLTGMFRHHFGLDSVLDEVNPARKESGAPLGEKNRNDHRNHALDALIVGLMDRAFLQRAARANAIQEHAGVQGVLTGFEEPWSDFRASARDAIAKIVVSHKLDHGIEDALHNQTAYGFARRADSRGNAIHRIAVSDLKVTSIRYIRGRLLRSQLVAALSGLSQQEAYSLLEELDSGRNDPKTTLESICDSDGKGSKDIEMRAQAYFRSRGVRRIRLIEPIKLIPIRDKEGAVYKGFKPDRNAYLDVFESDNGGGWIGDPVTCFDANSKQGDEEVHVPARGPRIHRLFNRDLVELEHQGTRRIFYIQKMSANQIALAEHFEANADSRTRDKEDPFRFVYKGGAEQLRRSMARFLVVTPAGKIRYISDQPDDTASS